MSVEFITIEQVKASLRMDADDTDDDALLEQLIPAACGMIRNYLKGQFDQYLDSGGSISSGEDLPEEICTAAIMLVGFLFKNNDQDTDGDFDRGYLPKPVTAILYPLRDPALA